MWKRKTEEIKDFFLETIFPRFCFGCHRENYFLCPDCEAVLEISEVSYCLCPKPKRLSQAGKCPKCQSKNLDGLYFALPYQKALIKKLLQKFKDDPFVKELAKPLSSLIINHFLLLDKKPDFSDFILMPTPLEKKRLKWRGFNQAEEIAKELKKLLEIPLVNDCLFEIKKLPQELEEERKERAFVCKNVEAIKGRKILLVDDIYTTGSTMEEISRVLKGSGAKEVWGVAVARGE